MSVVPVATRIVHELDPTHPSKSASVLLVTVWELGEAVGPLLIAPASEIFGRYPVMNAANILFISATALAAVSSSTSLLIAARALTGFSVAVNVLNPAIVGDMFIPEQRGSAMSMMVLAPLIGGAIGPAIAGALAQTLGWRKVMWLSVVLAGLAEVAFLCLFKETYKVRILRKKAARLRKVTGNEKLKTLFDLDEDVKKSGKRKLLDSVLRPALVLYGSGVLQMITLFGSVVFTYFYIMSTSLPDILETFYDLTPAEIGFSFIAFSIGSAVSVAILNLSLDRIYIRLRASHGGVAQAEHRLPLAIAGGVFLPLVVTMYGWLAQVRAPLPALLLSLGLLGVTLMLGFLPLMSYVVDAFGLYSASALTALIVCRCLMSTFLPLATEPLVERFGYGLGLTVFGVGSFCLVPIPVLVMRYGARWRQRSVYSRDEVVI